MIKRPRKLTNEKKNRKKGPETKQKPLCRKNEKGKNKNKTERRKGKGTVKVSVPTTKFVRGCSERHPLCHAIGR